MEDREGAVGVREEETASGCHPSGSWGCNEERGAPLGARVRSKGSSGRAPGGQGCQSGQEPPCRLGRGESSGLRWCDCFQTVAMRSFLGILETVCVSDIAASKKTGQDPR